uniref:Uncharacterized protein LOC104216481 n=1 Tax=Nicotiana sylvestris TaxID=4096 RepID=A0A1U7V9W8_NICSY|nr:PREDICTED: uncharacterized protein LOC104216481 [Nicotiana sylvestris]
MGFAEHFINTIWNLLANNWYSVLMNGQASGFFKSTRGVKQVDPLSPALFILSAEVLLRSLNKLFEDKRFIGYGMPKWTDPLNHLAYADDTIIFASADSYSLGKVVEVLKLYEQTSGQLINKSKSSYYMHANVIGELFNTVSAIIGFQRVPPEFNINEDLYEVAELRDEDGWNDQILDQNFPEDIAEHIKQEVHFDNSDEYWDIPKWMPTSSSKFTVSSAWKIMRHMAPPNPEYKMLWIKRLVVTLVQVHQVIRAWWSVDYCAKLRPLFQAAPVIIIWELWKRRNIMKHEGGAESFHRVVHEVNKTLHYLARVRYPWLPNIPLLWQDMIKYFEGYKPYIVTKRVAWQLPYEGWFKCNTDGASGGDEGSIQCDPSTCVKGGQCCSRFLANLVFSFAGSSYYPVVVAWLHAQPGGAWKLYGIPITSRQSIGLCLMMQSKIPYVIMLLSDSSNRFEYWNFLGIRVYIFVLKHVDSGWLQISLANCFGQLMYYVVLYHFPVVLALYNAHSGNCMATYGKDLFNCSFLKYNTICANVFLCIYVFAQLGHKIKGLQLVKIVSCFFLLSHVPCCRFFSTAMMTSYLLWCSSVVFIHALSFGLQKLTPGKSFVGATLEFLQLACGYICNIVTWRSLESVIVILHLVIISLLIGSHSMLFSAYICSNCKTWAHFGFFYLYIVATRHIA